MAKLDFPTTNPDGSPLSEGDVFKGENGVTYTYRITGSGYYWQGVTSDYTKDSNANIHVGDTPPSDPEPGDLWWDSSNDSGRLYMFYQDFNSTQWVETSPSGTGEDGEPPLWDKNGNDLEPKVATDNVVIGGDKITLNAADGSIFAEGYITSGTTDASPGSSGARILSEGDIQCFSNEVQNTTLNAGENFFVGYSGLDGEVKQTRAVWHSNGDLKIGGLVPNVPNVNIRADGTADYKGTVRIANWQQNGSAAGVIVSDTSGIYISNTGTSGTLNNPDTAMRVFNPSGLGWLLASDGTTRIGVNMVSTGVTNANITLKPDGSSFFQGDMSVDNFVSVGTVGGSAGTQGAYLWAGDDGANRYGQLYLYSNEYASTVAWNSASPVMAIASAPDASTIKKQVFRLNSNGSLHIGPDLINEPNISLNADGKAEFANEITFAKGTDYESSLTWTESTPSIIWRNPKQKRITVLSNTSQTVGVFLDPLQNNWSSLSQRSLKTNLTPITDGLNKVSTLSAVIGTYKVDEEGVPHPFLIADEVKEVLPEAVGGEGSEQDPLSLRYTEVIPLLVSALQDAKDRIENLEAEVQALKDAA